MRRADRLFRIVQLLRSRRLTTGAWLASKLEVSERTIYRDVRDLQLSGVPIRGEAGVGYVLAHKLDLPPLLFTRSELEALQFGLRVVERKADAELAKASASALEKILAALPHERRGDMAGNMLFVHADEDYPTLWLTPIRAAIRERRKALISYKDAQEAMTDRVVRPLGLFYWGRVWTFVAWCELRSEFREFRVDRLQSFDTSGEIFDADGGRNLAAYLDKVKTEHGVSLPSHWFDSEN